MSQFLKKLKIKQKKALKKLVQSIKPKGFGLIIRTVAEGQKVAALDADIQQLLTRWKNLSSKLKQIDRYPTKVFSESIDHRVYLEIFLMTVLRAFMLMMLKCKMKLEII